MIDVVLADLAAALHHDGVRGAAGRRVLAEARDHLQEAAGRVGEEKAIRAFGPPREISELVAAEVATAATRTAVVATFASLTAAALDFRHDLAPWWVVGTLAASASLALPLGALAVTTVSSGRPRATAVGAAEDVFDDLGPMLGLRPLSRLELPSHPWRFALLVGVVAAAAVAFAGIAGPDPLDGLVRGVAELIAVLVCFAALGRPLGLRRC